MFHYFKLPLAASINKNDFLIESVESASRCASMCNSEKGFQCKSFYFCERNDRCYLSKTHFVDGIDTSNPTQTLEENDGKIFCTHYSRDYLTDFTFTSEMSIPIVGEIVYKDLSAEDCARVCVTADAFNCVSFDYCGDSRLCLLNGVKERPIMSQQQQQQTPKQLCRNYRREYYFITSLKSNLSKVKEDSSESKLNTNYCIYF